MSFDWQHYLALANSLTNRAPKGIDEEAAFRAALSRSYYAAYCLARNHLLTKKINIPPASVHRFVRQKYQESTDRRERKIGNDLHAAFLDRLDADYVDDASIDSKRAQFACLRAQGILLRLEELSAP